MSDHDAEVEASRLRTVAKWRAALAAGDAAVVQFAAIRGSFHGWANEPDATPEQNAAARAAVDAAIAGAKARLAAR